ncbi:hypothetical protein AB0E11_27905 [Streptomyces fradiae]|uniref:hypothetical protein n=1 Tax=Streptomyces fradiae TaxID=1906 RepID=UPI0033C8CAC9
MALPAETVGRLVELFRDGASNRAAARELGITKGTAARYRTLLAFPPAPKQPHPRRSRLTVAEKFATFTRPAEDGHMQWIGRRASHGTPVFSHDGRTLTARPVAFRIATGREPVGYVTAECGDRGCVAPAHMEDEPGRARVRAQLAAVLGTTARRDACRRGHATAEHRRYGPSGDPYCGACREETRTREGDA